MLDLPYGENTGSKKQGYVAADLGINPNSFAHRALFDVLQLIEIFNKFPLEEILHRAKAPTINIVAKILPPFKDPKPEGKKDKDVAKSLGFRWKSESKTWEKQLKDFELEGLDLPFEVDVKR